MLEILIFGAVTSAIYAMLAVGFTLIFGVARILNLAHGSFYALGAYGAYVLTTIFKVPLLVAAPLVVLGVALFGMLVERVLIRPMRKSQLAVLMISLAVSLVVEQALSVRTVAVRLSPVVPVVSAKLHRSPEPQPITPVVVAVVPTPLAEPVEPRLRVVRAVAVLPVPVSRQPTASQTETTDRLTSVAVAVAVRFTPAAALRAVTVEPVS